MRCNERQLMHISSEEPDLEGILNYRKVPAFNLNQAGKGFRNFWFKLKSNLLFYFKINDFGQLDGTKEPYGVFVLENTTVQCEMSAGSPFAFSITFQDDPDRKHLFCARSDENVNQWVTALKQARYECMRARLVQLQIKIKEKTGKDPLLMYPHNKGVIRDLHAYRASLGAKPLSTKINYVIQQPVKVDNLIEL